MVGRVGAYPTSVQAGLFLHGMPAGVCMSFERHTKVLSISNAMDQGWRFRAFQIIHAFEFTRIICLTLKH